MESRAVERLAGFVAKVERIDGVFRQIRSQARLRQETIWSTLLFYARPAVKCLPW